MNEQSTPPQPQQPQQPQAPQDPTVSPPQGWYAAPDSRPGAEQPTETLAPQWGEPPTEQLGTAPTAQQPAQAGAAQASADPWWAASREAPTYGAPAPGGSYGALGDPGYAGPVPVDTSAAVAPAPARTRRGPGWGGVVVLVGAGMLLSSGVTLGGVVAYDQLLGSDGASTAATSSSSTQGPVSTASSSSDPDWSAVAAAVTPSTVEIQVAAQGGTSTGTGVVLDTKGNILTNNHVVDGGQQVQVTLSDGSVYAASIVGTDASTDLAVLRLDDPPSDLQPATFGDSSSVAVGQDVMAIGTPLGLQNTVTTGIVSATARPVTTTGQQPDGSDSTYTSAIQTDASINPGNSGGPLVDATGAVIGINSSIAGVASGQETSGSIGLGFAIPANTAKLIADQLIDGGTAQHAYLGVTTTDGSAEASGTTRTGAEVVSTEDGTPASKAGLRKGDVVVAVDDTPVDGAAALTGVVRGLAVDSEHTLTVVRDGSEQQLTVTLTAAS